MIAQAESAFTGSRPIRTARNTEPRTSRYPAHWGLWVQMGGDFGCKATGIEAEGGSRNNEALDLLVAQAHNARLIAGRTTCKSSSASASVPRAH